MDTRVATNETTSAFCLFVSYWLLLAALTLPLAGQQVYLRNPSVGYCDVVNASNTTPIRLTVSGACGLTEGATIVVSEVRGNTAANIHLESANDTANAARKVANLDVTGSAFDLRDLANQPVTGNGLHSGGGRVGLAAPYTLRPHPRLYLDGPAGARTRALSDPTLKANPVSPAYQGLIMRSNADLATYNHLWGFDQGAALVGGPALNAALRWKADGNTAALDEALWSVRNVDQMVGTTACTPEGFGPTAGTYKDCGTLASSFADYPLQFGFGYYQAYSLVHDALSAAEKLKFTQFLLSDLPWTLGGIGYTGFSRIKAPWKVRDTAPNWVSGTVTAPVGSRIVTGTGTRFTTQVTPGDVIVLPHAAVSVYGYAYLIESIQSNTQLILNRPTNEASTNVPWMAGPRWDDSMYGFLWHQKHQWMTPLTGAAPGVGTNPGYGDLSGHYSDADGNLGITRAVAMYAIGLATCSDDPRGCLLASLAYEWVVDQLLPFALQLWTGFSQSGTTYHQLRQMGPLQEANLWTLNSFLGAPDMLAETTISENAARYLPAAYIPILDAFFPNQENALLGNSYCDRLVASLIHMERFPTDMFSRNVKWWLDNQFGYSPQCIQSAGGGWTWQNYLLYNYNVVAAEPASSTLHFVDNNRERCIAVFGAAKCSVPDVRRMSLSKQNWTPQASLVALNESGHGCRDHCTDELGGYLHIFKAGKPLLSVDNDNLMGERSQRGYVEVAGSVSSFRSDPPDLVPLPVPWSAGDNTFMFTRADLTATYRSSVGVNSLERQVLHAKLGIQDYVLDHVYGKFSAPQMVRGLQHFQLNGCGTSTATSCVTLDRASLVATNIQPGGARLSSRVLPVPGSPILLDTDNHSNTDGSYPGGKGKSFRWFVCPSSNGTSCTPATAAEWIVLHRPSLAPPVGAFASPSFPSVVVSISGAFRIVEVKDPVSPKVFALTASGALSESLSFKTNHAGVAQYIAAGLPAGSWVAMRNGVSVGPAIQVSVGKHALTFSSVSGDISLFLVSPATVSTLTSGTTAGPRRLRSNASSGIEERCRQNPARQRQSPSMVRMGASALAGGVPSSSEAFSFCAHDHGSAAVNVPVAAELLHCQGLRLSPHLPGRRHNFPP